MEGKDGQLDGEGQPKSEEEPGLRSRTHRMGDEPVRPHHVERPGLRPKIEDANEHQEATENRVDHKLRGRVDAPLLSPHANQEVHGNEHRLPEDEEEEEVERYEDAQNGRLQKQHEDEKGSEAVDDHEG